MNSIRVILRSLFSAIQVIHRLDSVFLTIKLVCYPKALLSDNYLFPRMSFVSVRTFRKISGKIDSTPERTGDAIWLCPMTFATDTEQ